MWQEGRKVANAVNGDVSGIRAFLFQINERTLVGVRINRSRIKEPDVIGE